VAPTPATSTAPSGTGTLTSASGTGGDLTIPLLIAAAVVAAGLVAAAAILTMRGPQPATPWPAVGSMTPAPESARLLGASTPSSWPPPSLPPTAPVPLPDWHERTATVPSPSGARIVPAGYQIVGQPKRGGMAIVYKAYQPALDRYVALKMLSPEFSSDPEFLRRFHDEAKRTARLEHPHIVPIYDIGQVDGRVFIAMRWIDGLSLQELLAREGPLSARRALAIAAQVADATSSPPI
jgi:hypothetical protein